MKSLRAAVACGALATVALTGCIPPPDPTPTTTTTTSSTLPNHAPIAVDDAVTWTIPNAFNGSFVAASTTFDVLANDSDPDGDTLTPSGSGEWYLEGDLQPAGTYSFDEDGKLLLQAADDPLGPVQQLRPDEPWPASIEYTVSDGQATATATVSLTIVGGFDGPMHLAKLAGPNLVAIDFNDPLATVFDSRGCFANAEGFGMQRYWEAQSTSTLIPPDPAFISSADVEYIVALNSGWGFGSSSSVRITLVPHNNRPAIFDRIDFFVGDAGEGMYQGQGTPPLVPLCSAETGRPYTPRTTLPTLDLRQVTGDTASFNGNVLTNSVEPLGRPLTAGGQGLLGDVEAPWGTFKVLPDGTVTVTLNPDHPLPEGQYWADNIPYRAVGPDGDIGVGELTVSVIGRG